MSTSTFFHYKYLWRIADDARVRAVQFSNEHDPGNFGQGLVAILFAAAAAEAFINEVTYSVRQDTDLYPATAYHSLLVDFAAYAECVIMPNRRHSAAIEPGQRVVTAE